MATDMTVAITIRQQLIGGGLTRVMSWGAHNWVGDANSLTFKVQGFLFKGWVKITLNSMDLYDVKLIKKSKDEFKTVKEINGLYFDQLTDVIDEAVEKIPAYKR